MFALREYQLSHVEITGWWHAPEPTTTDTSSRGA
jgi:hypothetical protein